MGNHRQSWHPFDDGRSIGQLGTEQEIIERDDEHRDGARITLERDVVLPSGRRVPFAITCGVYGWMVHARFLDHAEDAQCDYEAMRDDLGRLLAMIPTRTDIDDDVDGSIRPIGDAIGAFVDRYQ